MTMPIRVGQAVQTPLGKGIVREVRNNDRLLVEVKGRAFVLRAADVTAIPSGGSTRRTEYPSVDTPPQRPPSGHPPREIDLHGLTVEEALASAARAMNDALLANQPMLHFIHGRSGGRIRGALHRWLREIPNVSGFRLDPRNPGVTIVTL